MPVEIRTVRPNEFEGYVDAVSTGFIDRPNVARLAEVVAPFWQLDRTWGAWDGDRCVGTWRSWGTELTVPGGAQVPAAAVSAVTVSPTHRRRGLLKGMTAAAHRAIRDGGEALAILWASEYPIYSRFGYGPATRTATWSVQTRSTSFTGAPVSGIELVTPSPETRDIIRDVFERWRVRQPGEVRRLPNRWDDYLGLVESPWGHTWKGFLALHRDGSGAVDGFARYSGEERWTDRQPDMTIKVNELHALTPEAYHALWRFVGEIDLATMVVAENRRVSERMPWMLTNQRAAVLSGVGEALWVRVFDVVRALVARSYERSGRLVLEVVDPEVPAPIRVALDATPDGATCRRSDHSPDLTLPIAALGAAYLGGTRLRDIVLGTGADEHRSGALAEADALFRTVDEPWCTTNF